MFSIWHNNIDVRIKTLINVIFQRARLHFNSQKAAVSSSPQSHSKILVPHRKQLFQINWSHIEKKFHSFSSWHTGKFSRWLISIVRQAAVYSCQQRESIVLVPHRKQFIIDILEPHRRQFHSFSFWLIGKIFYRLNVIQSHTETPFFQCHVERKFHSFSFWHIGKFSSWLNCIQSVMSGGWLLLQPQALIPTETPHCIAS